MDKKKEFNRMKIEEIQEGFFLRKSKVFFLRNLPDRKDKYGTGKFLYKALGLNAEPETIVLFQYDNKIVALAELTLIQKYDKPQAGDEYDKRLAGQRYNGAYYFEPNSIRVFDPIDNLQMQHIWGEGFTDNNGKYHKGFERFNRVRQFLNPIKYQEFYKILKNIRRP